MMKQYCSTFRHLVFLDSRTLQSDYGPIDAPNLLNILYEEGVQRNFSPVVADGHHYTISQPLPSTG